ncbi:MAG: hypothetical protein ACRDOX_04435, partial [Nocardioides sp.]
MHESPQSCPSCALPLRGNLVRELFRTLESADVLVGRIRAEATLAAPLPAPAPVPEASTATTVRRTGLRTASVPAILLGLGALCLLVAAIAFLAVAWSWLGVGGRTGVLVGLTVAAAGAGVVLGRRGLRIAAESLTTVSLGLVALDVVGAITAGWLGSPDSAASTALVGTGVAVVSGAILGARPRLVAPQLGVVLGLMLAAAGVAVTTEHDGLVAFVAVIALGTVASLGDLVGARVLGVTAAIAAGTWWVWLLLSGLEDAFTHPSLTGLWINLNALALLGAAVLLLAVAAVPVPAVARTSASATATILTLLLALPALDEGATAIGLALL